MVTDEKKWLAMNLNDTNMTRKGFNMYDQYNVILFIADRARGRTVDEISAETGLSIEVLSDWDTRHAEDIKRAKETLLDKILAYVFEDMKKQIVLLDLCLSDLIQKIQKLEFHPYRAEKAYNSLNNLFNTRTKIVSEATKLLLGYNSKKNSRNNASSVCSRANAGVPDGIL